jgi:biopolymer transport protein ExbD
MNRRLSRRKGSDGGDEINLSPLIDMTFLLLIFFVVSSTLVDEKELSIERPGASSGRDGEPQAIRVTVSSSGEVSVEGQRVEAWVVETQLRGLLQARSNRKVLIVADRRVEAERLIDVVDQARLAGGEHVAVAVNERERKR